jgi:hypothetical protein
MTIITRPARQLTDMQLVLLSSAAQHKDGLVIPTAGVQEAAFARALKGLLQRGLVEEVGALPDGSGQADSAAPPNVVKITPAGLEAIGLAPEAEGSHGESAMSDPVPASQKPGESPTKGDIQHGSAPTDAPAEGGIQPARAGTKQALVIALLSRPSGATLDELIAATGWLPHTTRAALTGLRQKGHALTRSKGADGKSIYSLPGAEG